MQITRQMQVEFVHRDDLGIATTSSTALDTKSRALGRLTHTGKRNLVQMGTQCLHQTNGGC